MPEVDSIYWLLPAGILILPLLAFVLILFFGKHMPQFTDKLAIIAMTLALALSVALFACIARDRGACAQSTPVVTSVSWMHLAGVNLTMGFLVDNLSAFMCIVVTGLATLVLIYSIFYMEGDSLYGRYFAYMCFFCFAMLGVVLSNNLLMTYVFWELVGLGSYLLIGFWFYKPPVAEDRHYQEMKASYATGIDERYLSPAHAQKKAFVMNRVGDFGFALGIAIFATVLLRAAGLPAFRALQLSDSPLSFDKLYAATSAGAFEQVTLLGLSGTALLTLAGCLTFMGAIGKSAQFPLHTWLPDAMQGPTTGSSIIHAATMVAAGVYMTARIHPLLTPTALHFVALIGAITAFLAATMALVQWDIKAVLAYSTISQLGYMMIGLGSGGYTAGLAHLFTHAMFKCMLFLGAGAVIVRCHHLQDMNRMGGLRHKMPLTHLAMLAGTLAITGVPLFSGFYSKDFILATALAQALEHGGTYWIPSLLAFGVAGLTAFYMFRLIFMTFWGEPRDHHVYEHAHEASPVAYVPLLILAALCLGFWWSGNLNFVLFKIHLPFFSTHAGPEAQSWIEALIVSPAAVGLSEEQEKLEHLAHGVATGVSILMLLLGLGAAYAMYLKKTVTPERLMQLAPLRAAYRLFSELWFIDRLYQNGLVVWAKKLNRLAWRFDDGVIDSWLVDGLLPHTARFWSMMARAFDNWIVDKCVDLFGIVTWVLGALARAVQAGKIQYYVCVTFGMVLAVWLGLMLFLR
ncbi:MAG: NADH-quinone oxidoreductase subunit L [Planctomycetota bacterium]